MRVLVIDDEEHTRDLLGALLTSWGYDHVGCSTAEEAMPIIVDGGIGIVICDWMLDGQDGLSFCRSVRAADLPRYTYFILLTSRGRVEDRLDALNAGIDEFIDKPFLPMEVRLRLLNAARITRLEASLHERSAELEHRNRLLEEDLDAAAMVQRRILPPSVQDFGGLRMASMLRPSTYLGGDILGYEHLNDFEVAFHAIDVAGHGTAAALQSFAIHNHLRPSRLLGADGTARDPADVVRDLNEHFCHDSPGHGYFTMIYGVVDLRDGLCRLCLAGHPPPLIIDPRDGLQIPVQKGFPVGLLPAADYHTTLIPLRRSGDTLILYSDGLAEAVGEDTFPARALHQLQAVAGNDLPRFVRDMEDLCINADVPPERRDDASLIAIQATLVSSGATS